MTLQTRLQTITQAGNLTSADLARWFRRPDATVRGWIIKGIRPGGGPLDIKSVEKGTARLEALLAKGILPLKPLRPVEKRKRLDSLRGKP